MFMLQYKQKMEVCEMDTELKKVAYDLTMEYFRQNNKMKVSYEITLEKRVKDFKEIYDEILSYLNK